MGRVEARQADFSHDQVVVVDDAEVERTPSPEPLGTALDPVTSPFVARVGRNRVPPAHLGVVPRLDQGGRVLDAPRPQTAVGNEQRGIGLP